MKALVKSEAGAGLELQEVESPSAGTNEVLIRVEKMAICGTDLHIYQWDEWAAGIVDPPLIPGHEFMGVIAEVGPGVRRYHVGQRVTAEGHLTCGVCRNCRAGRRHLCPKTEGLGVQRDGAFAEYVVMPEENLWPVPDEVPDEIAAFSDPLGNATHCALSFDVVGEDVLITGAGPIGQMATAICRFVGARNVVVTDRNPRRLELAKTLGATRAVNVEETTLEEVVTDLNMAGGFDVGLEMSGSPAALLSMIQNMYNGGRIALLGFLPPSTQLDWNEVILKSLHIKGIYGREMYETWYKMTQLLRSGLDVRPALTHQLPVIEFQRGFELMAAGDCGKIVMHWGST